MKLKVLLPGGQDGPDKIMTHPAHGPREREKERLSLRYTILQTFRFKLWFHDIFQIITLLDFDRHDTNVFCLSTVDHSIKYWIGCGRLRRPLVLPVLHYVVRISS